MSIVISKKKISNDNLKPFTSDYDEFYISTSDDFEDNNDFNLTEKNVKKIFDVINYSWDGDIYWFKNEDKDNVLNMLTEWFKDEKNHKDFDDSGIGNCFLIKYTPNGVALIDTQLDMSSNIDHFLRILNQKYPDLTYEYHSDCHLIDNLNLSRCGIYEDNFEIMNLLFKEKIIDASFFFDSDGLDEISDSLEKHSPKDKEIVITGTLPLKREEVVSILEDLGYKTSESIHSNSILLMGEKVGANKINKAQEKGVSCIFVNDLITDVLNSVVLSLKNKKPKP